MWGGSTSFPLSSFVGSPVSCISFSKLVQSMGDLHSGSKLSMDQRLMQLERRLQEQHDTHQQQLASFIAANTSLREESAALRNAAPGFPHPDTTAHCLMSHLVGEAPYSPSPQTTFLYLGTTHDDIGGSYGGADALAP